MCKHCLHVPLVVLPVEAEEAEGREECRSIVLQLLELHIVNFRGDGRVVRTFEHSPQLQVISVPGREGDAV